MKNLTRSKGYKTEILRLEPQNDIATQSLDRAIQRKELDSPVKFTRLRRRQRRPGPENDKKTKLCCHTNDHIGKCKISVSAG